MLVRLSGPPRNSMVFRFEAKHQQLKEYARVCFSRKNIPLTICKKFCLNFAHFLTQNQNRFRLIKDIHYRGSLEFPVSVPNCEFVSSLRYKGTCFSIGDIITRNNTQFIIRGIAVEKKNENVRTALEIVKRWWNLLSGRAIYSLRILAGFSVEVFGWR